MDIKNIVHIFNSSIVSGPEVLVLPSLRKLNLPVSVIFLTEKRKKTIGQSPSNFAKAHGLTVYEIEVRSKLDFHAIFSLRKLLQKLQIQLIHSHDVKASTYSLIATLFTNTVRVSTHHGIHGRPDWKTKFYECFYAYFILKFFHTIIAVSSSDHYDLQKIGLHQTICIFNGVTNELVKIQNKPPPPILAFIGRLSKEKRCDRILEVASILDTNDPNLGWKIHFFGSGKEEEALKLLTKKLKLENRVTWMGYKENIMGEMKNVSALISMSDAEGMPINMIEAGWAGLAIFATAVGGVNDLIPDHTFGVTFPKETSNNDIAILLQNFIKNHDSRYIMASSFQNRVKEFFSAEIWVKKHEDIYHSYQ